MILRRNGGGGGADSFSALIEPLIIGCLMLRSVYLGIPLFKMVNSTSIELNSFQFNHEQQLERQSSLSLLFLSEHIILAGCSLRFAAHSGLPAATLAPLYE